MKNLILVLSALFLCSLSVLSQTWNSDYSKDGGYWSISNTQGDELLGTKDGQIGTYRDGDNSLTYFSNSTRVLIHCKKYEIFDYELLYSDYQEPMPYFYATIGYYDDNDKLVERDSFRFFPIEGDEGSAFGEQYSEGAKKLKRFLKEGTGYVRIVAFLYGDGGMFDLKVKPNNKLL